MPLSRLFRRRPHVPFAEYGHEVRQFHLPSDGGVEYAQWLHPLETPKELTQAAVDAVRRFVRPGDFAIDVGAHTGDTTLPMALAAGPAGCVLALEPNPYVFKVLSRNASLNREKTHIDARCYAATQEDGRFVFHYTDASFCNGGFKSQQRWPLYRRRHPLTVEGRNLAVLLRSKYSRRLSRLSYVKIDAEGYDRRILESIRSILAEHKPVIRTEVFRKLVAGERHALFDLLAQMGYACFRYRPAVDPVGEKLTRDEMTRTKHFDIIALPRDRAAQAA